MEQLDWTVGQVLATLEKHKLMENTLILFSSDNGPVVDDGYADGSVENLKGHTPSGRLRGGKYSLYEGGTRVPLIAFWRGHIPVGVSDAVVSQTDLLASMASLAGVALPNGEKVQQRECTAGAAGPDSTDAMCWWRRMCGNGLRYGDRQAWKLLA